MLSYYGTCPNAKESLILFEAVKMGLIPTVSDRLSEEERKEIVSGAIYIWDEKQSPMRRWTDGRTWSNSRVVGDFLEYRESIPDPTAGKSGRYCIKPYGLRKRSICLPAYGDSSLRLIAYFTYSDIKSGILKSPSSDPLFSDIVKKLESNPSEQENLQLLASMRRRKRSKSGTETTRVGKWDADVRSYHSSATTRAVPHMSANTHLPPLESTPIPHYNETDILKNVSPGTETVTVSEASLQYPTYQPYVIGAAAIAPTNFPIRPDLVDKKSLILPSPVWRPLNMHSEDRRALNLLNSPPIHSDEGPRSSSRNPQNSSASRKFDSPPSAEDEKPPLNTH